MKDFLVLIIVAQYMKFKPRSKNMKTTLQSLTIIFLIILFFNTSNINAQTQIIDTTYSYHIKGKVVHFDTKKYLPYSDVTLTYKGRIVQAMTTNPYGMFVFDFHTNYVYDTKEFKLRFIKPGYMERVVSNINLKPSEPLDIQVNLRPVKTKNGNRQSTVDILDEIR